VESGHGADEWHRVAEPLWYWTAAGSGGTRRNPLINIAADAAAQMIAFAGHFGLTPITRGRTSAGSRRGKFTGLLESPP
jgi:hypothetical protein